MTSYSDSPEYREQMQIGSRYYLHDRQIQPGDLFRFPAGDIWYLALQAKINGENFILDVYSLYYERLDRVWLPLENQKYYLVSPGSD